MRLLIKRSSDFYQLWPVTFRFCREWYHWNTWFQWHGWQSGHLGFGRRIFGSTFHLGPMKICFGGEDGPVLLTVKEVEAIWHEGVGLERSQWESHHPESLARHYLRDRTGKKEMEAAQAMFGARQ